MSLRFQDAIFRVPFSSEIPDLWVFSLRNFRIYGLCFWEISWFIGKLSGNSQIFSLTYLNNVITFLLFVKSHQKVTISPSGYVHSTIDFCGGGQLPNLWGMVLDPEWQNPVSPSIKLPQRAVAWSLRTIEIRGFLRADCNQKFLRARAYIGSSSSQ